MVENAVKREQRYNRLAIDLDTLSLLTLTRCLFICWVFGFRNNVTIRYSSSGKGRHVIAWSKYEQGVDFHKWLFIRFLAGDDRYRLKKDRHGRIVQVLFYKKIKQMDK